MGYTKAIIPNVNLKSAMQYENQIEIIGVSAISQAIEEALVK